MTVLLKWNNRTNGDSIKVYRDTARFTRDSLPPVLVTLGGEITAYKDTGVADNTFYYYIIEVVIGLRSRFSSVLEMFSEIVPPESLPINIDVFRHVAYVIQGSPPNSLVVNRHFAYIITNEV